VWGVFEPGRRKRITGNSGQGQRGKKDIKKNGRSFHGVCKTDFAKRQGGSPNSEQPEEQEKARSLGQGVDHRYCPGKKKKERGKKTGGGGLFGGGPSR